MADSKETFESEDYSVTVEKKPGCVVDFFIKASPNASLKQYKKAVRMINKEVSLPGFRKGKAPENLIQKNFGPHLDKEWRELLLNTAFTEAMKLTGLHPFQKNSVKSAKVDSYSTEKGSEVSVTFEAEPQVPELDLSAISLEEVHPEPVEPKHVEQVIEDIRYQNTQWKEVEKRPVKEGDFIDIDIENAEKPGHFLCQDTRIEVQKGKLGKWLHSLLLGMNPGETKEAVSEQEEGEENPNFTPTKCKITVKTIFEAQLPEVDDALAKKVGADNVSQLRERLEQQLKSAKKENALEKSRENLKKAMVSQFLFDIPESIRKAEAQRLLTERTKALRAQSEGDIPQEKINALQEQVEQEVNDEIRWQFIIRRVVQENKIEASKEELIKEFMMHQYGNPAALQHLQDQEGVLNQVMGIVLKRKATDHLLNEISRR